MKAISIQKTKMLAPINKYTPARIINSFVEVDLKSKDDIDRIIGNPSSVWYGPSELTRNGIKCYYSEDNDTGNSTLSVLVEDMNTHGHKSELVDEFCGTVVFTSEDMETGELKDMTDSQMNIIKNTLRPVKIRFRKTDIDVFSFIHRPVITEKQ